MYSSLLFLLFSSLLASAVGWHEWQPFVLCQFSPVFDTHYFRLCLQISVTSSISRQHVASILKIYPLTKYKDWLKWLIVTFGCHLPSLERQERLGSWARTWCYQFRHRLGCAFVVLYFYYVVHKQYELTRTGLQENIFNRNFWWYLR